MALTDKLKAIADAIRGKTGKAEEMTLDQMAAEIAGIRDRLAVDLIEGKITEITDELFPGLERIHDRFFGQSDPVTCVHSTSLKTVGSYGMNSSKIVDFYAPNLTNLGTRAFQYSGIKTFIGGLVTDVPEKAFANCQLVYADFKGIGRISQAAFEESAKFRTLIIRSAEIAALVTINAFSGGPFASGGAGGIVLVPSACVTQYQLATNWAVLYGYGTNRFLSLEDYTVDGTVTGPIDWDRVNALLEEMSS